MELDPDLPLDTRERQIELLTAIVWESLSIYRADDEDAEPWAPKPRDCTGLDTAINALSEIREVRKAFPARAAAKPAKKTATVKPEHP
jgi:hypothetical protein